MISLVTASLVKFSGETPQTYLFIKAIHHSKCLYLHNCDHIIFPVSPRSQPQDDIIVVEGFNTTPSTLVDGCLQTPRPETNINDFKIFGMQTFRTIHTNWAFLINIVLLGFLKKDLRSRHKFCILYFPLAQ